MSAVELLLGHALDILKTMPDESVHCIITSPPYWGLRAYGTEPQIWLNGKESCAEHTWSGNASHHRGQVPQTKWANVDAVAQGGNATTDTCSVCGAWRGELGLEPTPELYAAHLVQIFHEAKRVLRNDGTLWLNLGDSYWGGKGRSGYELPHEAEERKGRGETFQTAHNVPGYMDMRPADGKHPIIKPKDLCGIPWMVAFALRADGWYLRSDIIWSKPNPMPESVIDRPTKAHEYVFLFSKSKQYYYDLEAVKENGVEYEIERRKREHAKGLNTKHKRAADGKTGQSPQSEHGAIKDLRHKQELVMIGKRNRRSVWVVVATRSRAAHFATFPPKLVEPMVLAGCPVDGTILDPFNGAGTTGLVAIQHRRNYIGIELKPEYIEMTRERLAKVQPVLEAAI